MKTFIFSLALIAFTSTVEAQTAKPVATCQIGTSLAVNTARQLAPGEKIVRVEGGLVTITQRETAGSSHIVFRRCVLPPTDVVVGSFLPWVKACGNEFIPSGWILPEVEALPAPPTSVVVTQPVLPTPAPVTNTNTVTVNVTVEPAKEGRAPTTSVAHPVIDWAKIRAEEERDGFWTRKKIAVVGAIVAAGVGYGTYYYYTCPPNTRR